jgi:hypothetical protein
MPRRAFRRSLAPNGSCLPASNADGFMQNVRSQREGANIPRPAHLESKCVVKAIDDRDRCLRVTGCAPGDCRRFWEA